MNKPAVNMCIDVKPRLGVAILKVVDVSQSGSQLGSSIVIAAGKATLLKDQEPIASIEMPETLKCLDLSLDLDSNGELYHRASLQSQQFSVFSGLPSFKLPKPQTKKLTKCLSECKKSLRAEGTIQVHGRCATCKNHLASLTLARILPLPSINWSHDSHNWFCACTSTDTQTPNAITNRRLANEELRPRENDMLYTESFVICDMKRFGEGRVSLREGIVSCYRCSGELGLADENHVKLWSNLVNFSTCLEEENLEADGSREMTFRILVEEIIKEYKFLSVKILLLDNSRSRALSLHVLESSGSAYVGEFDKMGSGMMREVKNHTVLFKEVDKHDKCDVTFPVSPKVFDEGLNYLRSSAFKFFPSTIRRDPTSGFGFGFMEVI